MRLQTCQGRQSQWKGIWTANKDPISFPSAPTPALTGSRKVHTVGGGTRLSITKLIREAKEIHITLSEKAHPLSASVTVHTAKQDSFKQFLFIILPYLIENIFIHPVSLNHPFSRKGPFRLTFQFESTEEIYL